MTNQYKGTVSINIGGDNKRLCFDWEALAKIRTDHGDALATLFSSPDPAIVASIIVIGLQKHHSGYTVADLMKASPPFIPMVQALDKAITLAYFGPDGAKELEAVVKGEQSEKAPKKKKK